MIAHIPGQFQIWASIAFRFNQRVSFTYNQKVSFKLVATELLWFIKGIQTFNTYLNIITIYGMNGHLKIMFSLMIIMDQT